MPIFLCGTSEVKLPNYDLVFLHNGGEVKALSSDGRTELSVSGATCAIELGYDVAPFKIELGVDDGYLVLRGDTLEVPSRASIRSITSPKIIDTLMTIGEHVRGDTVVSLIEALDKGQMVLELVYRMWPAPYGTVVLTNLRIERLDSLASGRSVISVQEVDRGLSTKDHLASQHSLSRYNSEAMVRREVFVLPETKGLTKPVTYTPSGFVPLRHVLRNSTGMSDDMLDSMIYGALRMVTQDADDYMRRFAKPLTEVDDDGARTAVAAIALLMYSQSSYAFDGHEVITPKGVSFLNAEAWNENTPRSLMACGDCDDSAMFGMWVCEQAGVGASAAGRFDELSDKPAMVAIRNALFHYEPMLTVTLATVASGSQLGSKASGYAGHAVVIFESISQLIDSINQGDTLERRTPSNVSTERIDIFYPPAKMAKLDATHETILHRFKDATPFVAEGTILASPDLYHKESNARSRSESRLSKQRALQKTIGANLGSFMVDLAVDPRTKNHAFYLKFIEFNLSVALPVDSEHRSAQWVAVPQPVRISGMVIQSGVTPQQMHGHTYAIVPLARETNTDASLLERMYTDFRMHRMAPVYSRTLSDIQSGLVTKNVERCKVIAQTVSDQHASTTDYVNVFLPPRTFMNNDASFEYTINRLADKNGTVTHVELDARLATTVSGASAAHMCMIRVPV